MHRKHPEVVLQKSNMPSVTISTLTWNKIRFIIDLCPNDWKKSYNNIGINGICWNKN